MSENEIYYPQMFFDIKHLAHVREDHTVQMLKPRGDCPTCGKQFRTPKDTKEIWYLQGYQFGFMVMLGIYNDQMNNLKKIMGDKN